MVSTHLLLVLFQGNITLPLCTENIRRVSTVPEKTQHKSRGSSWPHADTILIVLILRIPPTQECVLQRMHNTYAGQSHAYMCQMHNCMCQIHTCIRQRHICATWLQDALSPDPERTHMQASRHACCTIPTILLSYN